ncbi:NF-kappa-B inhibitor cactus isoform X2 [Periplaneta americana]|uniref:NF-kappa-B inhibitor cactus isoform X2 n=1 Tax=Periplaneta americana TaxID=6978 RepID=UPI0037E8D36D
MPSTAVLVKDSTQVFTGCASGHHLISKTSPHGLPSSTGISHAEEQKKESVKGQQDLSIARDPTSPTCMKGNTDVQSYYESGRTDSGFLSGANLSSECQSVEITSSSQSRRLEDTEGKEDANISMKLDSGVDVGLHEQFSSLSLKHSSLNDLNVSSSKSHSHDYSQISNINILSSPTTTSPPHTTEQPRQQSNYATWELYFAQDEDGDTQLHIAIIQGFIEVVYSLIRIVPNPHYLDILNDMVQTPLHLAVLTHQPRIARCLLVAGANVDIRDRRGNTPLHLACQTGDIECVKALTEPVTVAESSNANLRYAPLPHQVPQLEERNYDGQMCVHLAAIGGHVDVLRHLVWFGANINAREGKSGRTALHYAVEYGIHTVTRFLLEECPVGPSGLQLEMPNYAGYTAYQLASCLDSALARKLEDKGALTRGLPDDETDSDYSDDEMYGIPSDIYFTSHRINGEPINISA